MFLILFLFYNVRRVQKTPGVTAAMAAAVVDRILGVEDFISVTDLVPPSGQGARRHHSSHHAVHPAHYLRL